MSATHTVRTAAHTPLLLGCLRSLSMTVELVRVAWASSRRASISEVAGGTEREVEETK